MSELLKKYLMEIDAGVQPDAPQTKPIFLEDSRNVVYAEKSARPMPGRQTIVSPQLDEPIYGALSAYISGTPHLFFGNLSALYKYTAAGGVSDVSIAGGYNGIEDATTTAPPSLWSLARWGTNIVATNGVDTPQVYAGTAFADMTGLTFTTAEIFARHTPNLVAFNTSNGDDFVEWCARDDITLWTPAASNDAGNLQIRDLDSPIRCAIPFSKNIAFMSETMLFSLNYIGPPYYYGYEFLLGNCGVVGKHAAAVIGGVVYGFSRNGLWRADGSQKQPIGPSWVEDSIYADINVDQIGKAVVWHIEQLHSVVFCYPTKNSTFNNKAYGFNYLDNTWFPFNFGRSAVDNYPSWKICASGDYRGYIFCIQDRTIPPSGGVTDGVATVTPGSVVLTAGEGMLGYGQFGYGGILTVDG